MRYVTAVRMMWLLVVIKCTTKARHRLLHSTVLPNPLLLSKQNQLCRLVYRLLAPTGTAPARLPYSSKPDKRALQTARAAERLTGLLTRPHGNAVVGPNGVGCAAVQQGVWSCV